MRIRRVLVLAIIALTVLVLVMSWQRSNNHLGWQDCQRVGKSLRVSWTWNEESGCYIQQPNGMFAPFDAHP